MNSFCVFQNQVLIDILTHPLVININLDITSILDLDQVVCYINHTLKYNIKGTSYGADIMLYPSHVLVDLINHSYEEFSMFWFGAVKSMSLQLFTHTQKMWICYHWFCCYRPPTGLLWVLIIGCPTTEELLGFVLHVG